MDSTRIKNKALINISNVEKCDWKTAKEIYEKLKKPGLALSYNKSAQYYFNDAGKQDRYIEYHDNGLLFAEYYYVDDYKNGRCIDYYPSGNVWEDIEYMSGEIHGVYKYFSMSGELLIHRVYDNGVIVKHILEKDVYPPVI